MPCFHSSLSTQIRQCVFALGFDYTRYFLLLLSTAESISIGLLTGPIVFVCVPVTAACLSINFDIKTIFNCNKSVRIYELVDNNIRVKWRESELKTHRHKNYISITATVAVIAS